jgi:hypothetical protein
VDCLKIQYQRNLIKQFDNLVDVLEKVIACQTNIARLDNRRWCSSSTVE